jgi:uncharacterized lipoprotein
VRRALGTLALALVLVTPALAADPVELTYPADFDRVWTAAEKALKAEGWSIDDAARPLGILITKTQRLAGSDDGMQALNQRVRLRVTLTTAGVSQTRVQVQRETIRRERILWGERDSGVASADALAQRSVEERVLAAIAREL